MRKEESMLQLLKRNQFSHSLSSSLTSSFQGLPSHSTPIMGPNRSFRVYIRSANPSSSFWLRRKQQTAMLGSRSSRSMTLYSWQWNLCIYFSRLIRWTQLSTWCGSRQERAFLQRPVRKRACFGLPPKHPLNHCRLTSSSSSSYSSLDTFCLPNCRQITRSRQLLGVQDLEREMPTVFLLLLKPLPMEAGARMARQSGMLMFQWFTTILRCSVPLRGRLDCTYCRRWAAQVTEYHIPGSLLKRVLPISTRRPSEYFAPFSLYRKEAIKQVWSMLMF